MPNCKSETTAKDDLAWARAIVIHMTGVPDDPSPMLLRMIADIRHEERERQIGLVTALWGADLATTQAVMSGEMTLEEGIRANS